MLTAAASLVDWNPSSWRGFPAAQLPDYADEAKLAAVERELAQAAPVAEPADSLRLRARIATAAQGEAFALQGGDCAESFTDDLTSVVEETAELFEAMTEIIRAGLGLPVVEVARIAGQFAKPRTAAIEQVDGESLPAYRGDIVNGAQFDAEARTPDPRRMLRAHRQSLAAARLLSDGRTEGRPLYTSHEALLLPYEESLTRRLDDGWWSVSGHMLWLGDRTRQLGGAHVEYLRGIENVVGVKCGPLLEPDELLRLCERLEPENRPGRLILIARLGASAIRERLPALMRASRSAGLNALWMSDPMHGNTRLLGGRKVRRIDDILAEMAAFFGIARAEGVHPGGVHLEMTAAPVTECLGGRYPVSPGDLDRNYRSACDPRLNRDQAIDLAHAIARIAAPAAAH